MRLGLSASFVLADQGLALALPLLESFCFEIEPDRAALPVLILLRDIGESRGIRDSRDCHGTFVWSMAIS